MHNASYEFYSSRPSAVFLLLVLRTVEASLIVFVTWSSETLLRASHIYCLKSSASSWLNPAEAGKIVFIYYF